MKPLATMNVIPFIDVMLVLLAIVLTTATFVAQGKIPIRLPGAEQAEAVQTEKPVEISISESGALFVDEQPVGLDDFAAAIAVLDSETAIRLRVDERVAFRHFVQVIDSLKAAGLNRLSIATQRVAE